MEEPRGNFVAFDIWQVSQWIDSLPKSGNKVDKIG